MPACAELLVVQASTDASVAMNKQPDQSLSGHSFFARNYRIISCFLFSPFFFPLSLTLILMLPRFLFVCFSCLSFIFCHFFCLSLPLSSHAAPLFLDLFALPVFASLFFYLSCFSPSPIIYLTACVCVSFHLCYCMSGGYMHIVHKKQTINLARIF